MKNLIRFIQVFVIINVMILSAQAQSVSLSASADTGNPGDKITFTWSYDLGGQTFDRQEIKFDGKSLPNLDKIDSSGTFVWTVEPGTHVFRVFLRVVTGNGFS